MYWMSTTLICAWRPLMVVTSGACNKSVPPRCSNARTTTRNCGSVRMPVSVAMAGAPALLRKPEVTRLSVGAAGIANGPGTPGDGPGPGNTPLGFAGLDDPGTMKLGALPP